MDELLFKIFEKFWGITEKSDAKNHATQSLPEGIKEENDFAYIEDGHVHHLLDVYYPEKHDGPLPVIIDIHGGGWMYGDKELNKIYCEYIASRGFIIFNMSYRLVPEVRMADQLRDISAALKWINENLERFPADRSKIMLTGDSAGGQLCAFTAAISNSAFLREHFGCEDHGLKFNCIALTSPVPYLNDSGYLGAYGRLMSGEAPFRSCMTPYLNVDEVIEKADAYPPVFMVTSSGDFLGLKQTRRLKAYFMKKGIESELMEFPKFEGKDLPHVFSVLRPMDKPGVMNIDRMCAFFREHF